MRQRIIIPIFGLTALFVFFLNFQSPVAAGGAAAVAPVNDNCAAATDLNPLLVQNALHLIGFDTTTATNPGDDPCMSCSFFGPGQNDKSVWFKITPTAPNLVIRANTYGSKADTIMAVWQTVGNVCPTGTFTPFPVSTCDNAPAVTEVACNDDSDTVIGFVLESNVTFTADGTSTYFIEVADSTGTATGFGGLYNLNLLQAVR